MKATLRFCATPGCHIRISSGHCRKHRRVRDLARGTKQERGYDRVWELYSQQRLADHPYCVGFPKGYHERPVLAEVTDHILSAKARPDLFHEPSNHQSLCHNCNRRKAIALEGGFGFARSSAL